MTVEAKFFVPVVPSCMTKALLTKPYPVHAVQHGLHLRCIWILIVAHVDAQGRGCLAKRQLRDAVEQSPKTVWIKRLG